MEPGKSAQIAAKKIQEKYKKLSSKKKPATTTTTTTDKKVSTQEPAKIVIETDKRTSCSALKNLEYKNSQ